MPYTAPSLTTAAADLASRLNDLNTIRWVAAELPFYLREALRTWSTWTSAWRAHGSFVTTMNEAFYDLATNLPTLRGQTITNWDLVTDLQIALLEPAAPGGTWTGTDQFSLAQLSTAIQRRRDQLLKETGQVLTRSEIAYAAPPASGRIDLDESVLNVRRAAWRVTSTGLLLPLLVTDEWAGANFQPTWVTSTQPPQWYSVSVTPPLTLQLMPPTAAAGTLDLVSINKGSALTTGINASLGVPDDWAWVIKYGALADLLSGDGLALDPARAAYCESRWQQGLEFIRRSAVVLSAQISNDESPPVQIPCRVGSLSEADRYSPTWQLVSGIPRTVLLAGGNLVALWPPPGGTFGQWTISLDVVQNAPVPLVGTDILQIAADVYDSILDLAQHIALLKEGPGQIEMAMGLDDRAARAAGITNQFQQASQPSRAPLLGQTPQDRRAVAEQRGIPVTSVLVEG